MPIAPSTGIEYLLSEEVLEVHLTDVEEWGLEDGGCAVVSSRRGSRQGEGPGPPRSRWRRP